MLRMRKANQLPEGPPMESPTYLNSEASLSDRLEDLLGRMTLEEKAGLLFHSMAAIGQDGRISEGRSVHGIEVESPGELIQEKRINHFHLIDGAEPGAIAAWHNSLQEVALETRLQIPVTVSSDPRHAISNSPFFGIGSSCFSRWPLPTGLAATRDCSLVQRHADIVRQEYAAVGIRVALHPQLDLSTEPRWIRTSGTFGEDAELASDLGRAYIRGLQGVQLGPTSVSAMAKHFPGGGAQKNGDDAHVRFGREQVYPGNHFDYHLKPFAAAIQAGCSQIMPYYSVPIGTEYEEIGFAFNGGIITNLLRSKLKFDGIVCADWCIINDWIHEGRPMAARAWGVEHLTPLERVERAMDAGVDQFGGESCPELIVELVRQRRIPEARVDQSARRLLREKFSLGLFDNRFVDVSLAQEIVGSDQFVRAGRLAQSEAITILRNREMLPLRKSSKIYVEGADKATVMKFAQVVDHPRDADLAVIRLNVPQAIGPAATYESQFRAATLEIEDTTIERILRLNSATPVVVDVQLERPLVLGDLVNACHALVANYGASDSALFEALFGHTKGFGRLPFDLPSSTSSVKASRTDVPFDARNPLYRFGAGQDLSDATHENGS